MQHFPTRKRGLSCPLPLKKPLAGVFGTGVLGTGVLGAGMCGLLTSSALAASGADILAGPPAASSGILSSAMGFGLLGGLVVVAGFTAYTLLLANRAARTRLAECESEISHFKKELGLMQAVLGTQPQIVMQLDAESGAKLLFHSLQNHEEIPSGPRELLDFGSWIEDGLPELKRHMITLLQRGHAFCITVRTTKGLLMEAEGKTSGQAMLIFRDLSGSLRKEVHLLDRKQKLKNRIKIMQNLLDALPMPVWFRDPAQELSWVNKAYIRAVDAQDRQEVYDKKIELLERSQLSDVNRQLGEQKSFHGRMNTITGNERKAFDVIAVPQGDESGSIAIDLAALETAEDELELRKEAYFKTLNRVSAGLAIFDSQQRLDFFNKAYADLWQLDEKWLDSKPRDGEILDRLRAARLLPEQANYPKWKQDWLSTYASDEQLEDKWYLQDGRALHVVADHNPDGGMTYMFDNLTESINLQSSFNALLNVQRETLDALREGVAVFASNGRLKLSNPAFQRIWQLSDEQLVDEPHIEQVIHLCRPLYDSDEDWDTFRRAVTGIDVERRAFEGRFQRHDEKILAFASFPLPDGGTLLTFVDITDEERAEQALLEKNKALQEADRLKNDFISNVSYELRTPLTTIMGFGEMLENETVGELNTRQRDYLASITASSAKLEGIISNILDLVTMDAGSFELNLEPVKISEILKATKLGVRDRLEKEGLELDIDVDGNLDTINADGQRVVQVLYNLLQNAIGFSDSGKKIKLHVKEQGPMVAFSVEDEGCGIPKDIRDTVFERFESCSLGSKHRGVGLGLSIVSNIVEMHGGDVDLLSREGVGTKITVRFPKEGKKMQVVAAE